MVISKKQQAANRRNAQRSTGPKTPEGKAAVCLNALTYGLRARNLLIGDENLADYHQLWAGLEFEWQPQTHTERHYLEQMSTSQWLLARTAASEQCIYAAGFRLDYRCALLDRLGRQRVRLERSFDSAMRELKQLQKERQARLQQQPAQPAQDALTAPPPLPKPSAPKVPPPAYVMSEAARDHPAFCSSTIPDSR